LISGSSLGWMDIVAGSTVVNSSCSLNIISVDYASLSICWDRLIPLPITLIWSCDCLKCAVILVLKCFGLMRKEAKCIA
jgi:hypothetical protein